MPQTQPTPPTSLHKASDAVASSILQALYPAKQPTIEQTIVRPKTVLYILKDGGSKMVLRLSDNSSYTAKTIAACYELWNSVGVPVPTVKAAGVENDVQYLLMDYIDEAPFDFDLPEPAQLKMAADMGKLLAKMRSVHKKEYGPLDEDGNGTLAVWSEFLNPSAGEWLAERGHITNQQAAKIQQFYDSTLLAGFEPTLLSGDFKPKSSFVQKNGTVVALSDPRPVVGDPLWDFATFNHFVYRAQARKQKPFNDGFFNSLRASFKQAYEAELGRSLSAPEMRRLTLYEVLIDARKVMGQLTGRLTLFEDGEVQNLLTYLLRKIELLP